MNTDRQMPEFMAKIPLIAKILIGGVPILLGIIYVLVMNSKITNNSEQFYRQGFSSIVSRRKTNSFTGRTTEFHLQNGLKIYLSLSKQNTLVIGDSIKKGSSTYIYDVYRKDINGEYKFWATYDFEKVY